MDIKRVNGYDTGVKIGTDTNPTKYSIFRLDTWNNWDDLALYKSLYRLPTETNIELRDRIISSVDYNSTVQGLVNWLSDSFGVDKYIVDSKLIYTSTNQPLSFMQYSRLDDQTEDYYPPRVVISNETETELEIIFPEDRLRVQDDPLVSYVSLSGTTDAGDTYVYDNQSTIITHDGITWTLWKNLDQSYSVLWGTNTPISYVKLKYQCMIDGELCIVEESAYDLVRDENGNVIEDV